MPERVHWEDKVPNGQSNEVAHHPSHVDHLSRRDEDEDRRESEDRSQQHERDRLGERFRRGDDRVDDECPCQADGHGEYDSPDQVHEDDELHREAERAAEIPDPDELHEVVDRRIDPSSALREQYRERIRSESPALCLREEDVLAVGERSEHDGGQEPVFSK
jgi:hypothetical protein